MSDTPTPADTCPRCGSTKREVLHMPLHGRGCLRREGGFDPWHSSPVPAADTPTPAEIIARLLYMTTGPVGLQDSTFATQANRILDALAAAGFEVVAVPDGLVERLVEAADETPRGQLVTLAFTDDLRAAAALLGGEEDR